MGNTSETIIFVNELLLSRFGSLELTLDSDPGTQITVPSPSYNTHSNPYVFRLLASEYLIFRVEMPSRWRRSVLERVSPICTTYSSGYYDYRLLPLSLNRLQFSRSERISRHFLPKFDAQSCFRRPDNYIEQPAQFEKNDQVRSRDLRCRKEHKSVRTSRVGPLHTAQY